ncbi:unnamed protein product [Peniophora sp. CBMAI 1063]|nr:unnamed protein product [Peniophora sp. CBMAI 1063]
MLRQRPSATVVFDATVDDGSKSPKSLEMRASANDLACCSGARRFVSTFGEAWQRARPELRAAAPTRLARRGEAIATILGGFSSPAGPFFGGHPLAPLANMPTRHTAAIRGTSAAAPFSAETTVAFVCLGASTQVSYTPQAMKAAMKDKRFQAAARKHALRITLIHGDMLVLSGAALKVCGPYRLDARR